MLSLEEMKANRRKWVEALRSGKYVQTQCFLHAGGGFCCLGVLADIAGAQWVPDTTRNGGVMMADEYSSECPEFAMRHVGLATSTGEYGGHSLAIKNDAGLSFKAIANIIEAEPHGLFVDSVLFMESAP